MDWLIPKLPPKKKKSQKKERRVQPEEGGQVVRQEEEVHPQDQPVPNEGEENWQQQHEWVDQLVEEDALQVLPGLEEEEQAPEEEDISPPPPREDESYPVIRHSGSYSPPDMMAHPFFYPSAGLMCPMCLTSTCYHARMMLQTHQMVPSPNYYSFYWNTDWYPYDFV